MRRRLVTSFCLAYLVVAFGFVLLTMLNASDEGAFIAIAGADAAIIVVLCLLGIVATAMLGVRILIDGKRRRELERMVHTPRRKSDIPTSDT